MHHRRAFLQTAVLLLVLGLSTGLPQPKDLLNPRGWKASHEATQKFLAKLRDSKAIAALPSHISLAQAELLAQQQAQEAAQQAQSLEDKSSNPQPPADPAAKRTAYERPETQQIPVIHQGYHLAQLIVPAALLSIASLALGWIARGCVRPPAADVHNHDTPLSGSAAQAGDEGAVPARQMSERVTEILIKAGKPAQDSNSAPSQDESAQDTVSTAEVEPLRAEPEGSDVASHLAGLDLQHADASHEKQAQGLRGSAPDTGQEKDESCSGAAQHSSPDAETTPPSRIDSSAVETSSEHDSGQEPEPSHAAVQPDLTSARVNSGNEASTSALRSEPVATSEAGNSGTAESIAVTGRAKNSVPRRSKALVEVNAVMEVLIEQLGLDASQLSPQEKMQLMQMALQCCQHHESSRLHVQANELRASHASTAEGTLAHKRQQAAEKEARRQVSRLQIGLQDGLMAGLSLSLATTLFCGVKCGYIRRHLARCPTAASLPAVSFWRPWAALEGLKLLYCYVHYTSEALMGCVIMLITAYVAVRSGVFAGSAHNAPLLKIAIALGLICAFAGYQAVNRLGGSGTKWLLCWETWVLMHMAAAWQLPLLQRQFSSGKWADTRMVIYQGCLFVVFPVAMGVLPFSNCLPVVRSSLSYAVGL